jgi:circadian clock protein KaiB
MSGSGAVVQLRLYVAGRAPNSVTAMRNLDALTADGAGVRWHVEVVDVMLNPQRALDDQVLLTPTLVRVAPRPVRRIIGDLSDVAAVRRALGMV